MAELATPIGRLAPSPTGLLHLGHARSFLLAWWQIRSRGGRIVLRMEDLDELRVRPEYGDQVLRDLEWLGIDWDGEPLWQSSRLPQLRDALDRLVADGFAYPCVCTRREIRDAVSAPHAEDGSRIYPGTCRGRFSSIEEALAAAGRPPALRFRVDEQIVEYRDRVHGPKRFALADESGDFMIGRAGGNIAYQLAVVVDDAHQSVNEILRGDDLLLSTAQQKLLQTALALPHPSWTHVPLVLDARGIRLAKRHDALSLQELRQRGCAPETIVAWCGRTAGLDLPARCTAEAATSAFDVAKLTHRPISIDSTLIESWIE